MTLFQEILPKNTPVALLKQDRLTIWLDRILQTLLLGAMLTGWTALLLAMPGILRERSYGLLILGGLLLVELTAVLFMRSAPYALRSGGFLIGVAVVTLTAYLANNLLLASICLLALMLFTVLLIATRRALIIMAGWLVMVAIAVAVRRAASGEIFTPAFMISALVLLVITAALVYGILLLKQKVTESSSAEFHAVKTLEKERAAMDNRLADTTRPYITRLVAARAAAEISRHISTIRNPDDLLKQVVELMKDRFKLYYIGIFVVDESGRYAQLKTGTGEAGARMVAQGHRLVIGDASMIGWAVKHKEPRIAQNVKSEMVRFNNPLLPDTRSELALPIVSRGASLGAMTVQSTEENAFDEDDILIMLGIAGSLAAAMENTRLDQQLQDTVEEVRVLNRTYLQQAWSDSEHSSLNYTYETTLSATGKGSPARHTFALTLRDHVIGEIAIDSDQETLTDDETALIEAIALQTAIALESARLLEETQQRAFEEQKLNDLSEQFSQAANIDDILRIAVKELGELPSAAEVSIHLLAPDTELELAHSSNGHKPEVL